MPAHRTHVLSSDRVRPKPVGILIFFYYSSAIFLHRRWLQRRHKKKKTLPAPIYRLTHSSVSQFGASACGKVLKYRQSFFALLHTGPLQLTAMLGTGRGLVMSTCKQQLEHDSSGESQSSLNRLLFSRINVPTNTTLWFFGSSLSGRKQYFGAEKCS